MKAVLAYLVGVRRFFAWRNNSGAAKVDGRLIRFGMPGSADVLGVLPGGRAMAVEVKQADRKARPTPNQVNWLARFAAAGGLALVVRSVDELREALARAGHPERKSAGKPLIDVL